MNEPVFHYFGNKAGVQGAEEVKKVIDQVTKGSDYYKRQQDKRSLYVERIQKMQKEIDAYRQNAQRIEHARETVKAKEAELAISLERVWAHFDMDMFFVACELLDKPELKEKPVAVGGSKIISTANYVARKFGVRSAMPTFVAQRLCPDLIVLPSNFEKYKNVSNIFMNILKNYDPELESMGMDEANLDLTDYLQQHDLCAPEQISKVCNEMREQIKQATNLTASCGVGPNKMIAKLASERNKPDGLFVVEWTEKGVLDFVGDLPIRKIPGIGSVTEQILDGLEFKVCRDVRERADELLVVLTPKTFDFIFFSCWGCSRNQHSEPEDQLSVSCQRTFKATAEPEELERRLEDIAHILQEDLNAQEKMGCHLTLVVKTSKFELKNKSMQLNQYCSENLINYGRQLLRQFQPYEPIRLLGLKMSQLILKKDFDKRSILQYFQKSKSNVQSNVQSNAPSKQKQEFKEELKQDLNSNFAQSLKQDIKEDFKEDLRIEINKRLKDDEIQEEPQEPDLNRSKAQKQKENERLSNYQIGEINYLKVPVQLSSNEESLDQFQKDLIKPSFFVCFNCNKQIDTKGNNNLMNKHIDRCVLQMGSKSKSQTVDDVIKKRKK